MSDDAFMHISSNSSNQSDQSLPTKISRLEKLEARLVGKSPPPAASVQPLKSAVSTSKFGPFEDLAIPSTPSDSDDDNGREFLIQANTQNRQKLDVHVEGASEEKQKTIGILDSKADFDMNRKNHGRGRGNTVSSKGRCKNYDQSRIQAPLSTILPSIGHLEDCHNKDDSSQEQLENDPLSSLKEETTTLHAKVVGLEEDLCKSHQELKDLKEYEQQMKPKDHDDRRKPQTFVEEDGSFISNGNSLLNFNV